MKKQDILSLVSLLLVPGLLVVFGVCLLMMPNRAAALISLILGWCLLIAGVGCAVWACIGYGRDRIGTWQLVAAIVLLGLGGTLVRFPLLMAAAVGCILGALLLAEGIHRLHKLGDVVWGTVTVVIGAVLILLPLTTSRLVLMLVGAAMAVAGALMLYDRLSRWQKDHDDPNIIDAL